MRYLKIAFFLVFVSVISYVFYFFLFTTLKTEQAAQSPQANINQEYDLVIKHAQILDGSGEKEMFRGDIAIRDGLIVEVGSVQEREFPTFDAGGLTVMPSPVYPSSQREQLAKNVLEHLFRTSYPRYPAYYLYFQEPPYQGFNLAQVAQQRGESVQTTFNYLQNQLPATVKVYLVPLELSKEMSDAVTGSSQASSSLSLPQLAAYLTYYPAKTMDADDLGIIKPEFKADLHFFITRDYTEENLKELFLRGQLPEAALYYQEGQLLEALEQ